MAKLKIVIRKNRLDKEGMTPVLIALSHKSKTAYFPVMDKQVTVRVKPEDFIAGEIVSRDKHTYYLNDVIMREKKKIQNKLDELESTANLKLEDIKLLIDRRELARPDRLTITEAFNLHAQDQRDNGKPEGNVQCFHSCQTALIDFFNGIDPDITILNKVVLLRFRNWLKTDKKLSGVTANNYMGYLKTIYLFAKKNSNVMLAEFPDIEKLPEDRIRENCITLEQFKAIRDFDAGNYKDAQDIFLLSFYLGGMNVVDLYGIDFRNDEITYIRQKVQHRKNSKKTVIPILPEARMIINRYINKRTGILEIKNYDTLSYRIRVFLNTCKKDLNLPCGITYYSARKCFAQTGLNIGISDSIIDYILGHSSRGIIQHYSHLNSQLAKVAMEKIFAQVDNPQSIEELMQARLQTLLFQ